MICEECPLAERCIERRGLCRDYLQYMERVERTRRQIEQLNENNTAPAEIAVPTDQATEG